MSVNNLMEIGFDVAYLVIIYILVALMAGRMMRVAAEKKTAAILFFTAFLLLALGDTGHVGFRVIAYLNGGLQVNRQLLGIGSFITAFTVTIFYMLLIEFYRCYSGSGRTPLYWLLMILLIGRIVFIFLPGNNWGGEIVLLYSWIRNALLLAPGIAVAFLYMREGRQRGDRTLVLFAIFIFVSFAFYLPVILFVHALPAVGVLMIPKTSAYVALAVTGYCRLFVPVDIKGDINEKNM